ncbi:MAG TPA: electron transport complex subunit RsxG [Gammaproteobacteria bacterium]
MDAGEPGIVRAIASIGAIAVVAALLVSSSYELSRDRIEENRRERLLRSLDAVIGSIVYDNDLAASRITVIDTELLGSSAPIDVFVARRNGAPVAALFASVAPRGYNGPIRLLVGIATDGHVTGVRVTDHNETPGLGDSIELGRSNWILGFDGRTLTSPTPAGWAVVPDGGVFDSITGATVTPRAVVKSVRDTLTYFDRDRDAIFSARPESGDE